MGQIKRTINNVWRRLASLGNLASNRCRKMIDRIREATFAFILSLTTLFQVIINLQNTDVFYHPLHVS